MFEPGGKFVDSSFTPQGQSVCRFTGRGDSLWCGLAKGSKHGLGCHGRCWVSFDRSFEDRVPCHGHGRSTGEWDMYHPWGREFDEAFVLILREDGVAVVFHQARQGGVSWVGRPGWPLAGRGAPLF